MSVVKSFKKGILDGRSSTDMCFMVCAPLAGYLDMLGVPVAIVEGNFRGFHHYWLEKPDGTVIDPTCDQFNDKLIKPMPAVYIGPRSIDYMKK